MLTKLVPVLAIGAALLGSACSNTPTSTNAANASNKPANTALATNKPADLVAALAGMDEATHAAYKAKCAICHGQDGKGHSNAPNLFTVPEKRTAAQWEEYLKNPKTFEKSNKMPTPMLEDGQRKMLAAWLAATTGAGGGKAEDGKTKS